MVKSGFLVIDKPEGYTSHDVVARLRHFYKTKKIGHTGTLDPNVTGVLPIAIGKATRAIEYLEDTKAYDAEMTLGIETDTLDRWGTVVKRGSTDVSEALIRKVFDDFIGLQMQIPPMYSAVHVQGVRLHQLARVGKEVDRPARQIEIHAMGIKEIDGSRIRFNVSCSAGTYIRQLISDMGKAMGTFAHLSELRRSRSGIFLLKDAYSLDKIEAMNYEERNGLLLPIDSAIDLPQIGLDEKHGFALRNGQRLPIRHEDTEAIKTYAGGVFYGVASVKDGLMKMNKLFLEDES